MHRDFRRAVGMTQRVEHFGNGQMVVASEFGSGGVEGRHVGTISGRMRVARVLPLQAGVAALRFDQRVGADGGGARRGNVWDFERERHRFCCGLATDAQHAALDQKRWKTGLVQHDFMLFALGMLQAQITEGGAEGFGELAL